MDLVIPLANHLLKIKKKFKKLKKKTKKTGDTRHFYRSELDKVCFQHDMANEDFTNSARGITSDKFLGNKAFNIAKNPNYGGYQRGLASMVYKFFEKKSASCFRQWS